MRPTPLHFPISTSCFLLEAKHKFLAIIYKKRTKNRLKFFIPTSRFSAFVAYCIISYHLLVSSCTNPKKKRKRVCVRYSTGTPGTSFGCRTELTEVSGTGMKACTSTGGTGHPYRIEVTEVSGSIMYVVPNFQNCPVLALMSYRRQRSVQYRYGCREELSEPSVTAINVIPCSPKCPVPVWMSC